MTTEPTTIDAAPTEAPVNPMADLPKWLTEDADMALALPIWAAIFTRAFGKISFATNGCLKFIADTRCEFAENDRRRPAFLNFFRATVNSVKGTIRNSFNRRAKHKLTPAVLNPFFVLDTREDGTEWTVADEATARWVKACVSEISRGLNAFTTARIVPGKDDHGDPLPPVNVDLTGIEWDGDGDYKRFLLLYTRHEPASANRVTSKAEIEDCWDI